MTINPQPKDNPKKRPLYFAWLKTQPCIACGRPATEDRPSIPAHQSDLGPEEQRGGMALKPDDMFCLPLCYICHDREHRGHLTFWGDDAVGHRMFLIGILRTRWKIEKMRRKAKCL